MTRIVLAPEVLADFDRFLDPMAAHSVPDAAARVQDIIDTIQVLTHSPLIGRPARAGKLTLVIGRDARGYVALYRCVPALETVFILAIRHQRERGFERER